MLLIKTIIILLPCLVKTTNIQLYDKVGVAMEDLEQSLILTNGVVAFSIRIEMDLPQIDGNESADNCEAASNGEFSTHVSEATKKFTEHIKEDLAEYINLPEGPEIVESGQEEILKQVQNHPADTEITLQEVKDDPKLCDDDNVSCAFMPIVDDVENELTSYGLRACYSSGLGEINKTCHVTSGIGMCCSKVMSKNEHKCPTKNIHSVLKTIAQVERKFPDRSHTIGRMKDVHTKRIQNYCIGLVAATINRKREIVGKYTDSEGDVSGLLTGKFWPHNKQPKNRRSTDQKTNSTNTGGTEEQGEVSLRRQRRSNWAYYTQGGFWSSSYIDSNIDEVKQLINTDASEMKAAIKKNSKILLTLEGDIKEKQQMKRNICGITEELTEKMLLDELHVSQDKLERKSESILRDCKAGLVPDAVENEHLEKICSATSDSSHCFGEGVRSLFQCELAKPLISLDLIGISMKLTMSVPIDEPYKAFKIFKIGVPFSSGAVDTTSNLTDETTAGPKESKSGPNPDRKVEEVLKQIFSNLQKSLDHHETQKGDDKIQKDQHELQKREVISTFHFLRLRSLPDLVTISGKDVVSFNMDDAIVKPWGLIVDYSTNRNRDSLCVESIMRASTKRIAHFCNVELTSSGSNCVVKKLGDSGYLVSSREPITVTDVSDKRVQVFNSKVEQTCKGPVCAVTIKNTDQKFRCGNRDYLVGARDNVVIKINAPKMSTINLEGLKSRKDEVADLTLTGYDFLDDKIGLTKKSLSKVTTMSSIWSLLVMLFVSIVLVKTILRKGVEYLYSLVCNLPCIVIKSIFPRRRFKPYDQPQEQLMYEVKPTTKLSKVWARYGKVE